MQFEWNSAKATTNQHKHGISFEQAVTAFDDPNALIAPDSKHSSREAREWLIGESDVGVLVVILTRREKGEVLRLISARRANQRERRRYEAYKRIPI